MKKRRVIHTIKQKQAKCARCKGFPEMAVQNESGTKMMLLCLPCAEFLAKDNDVPGLAAQVALHKVQKAAESN